MDSVEDLHRELIKLLDLIGEYKVEKKKSSIHIVRERAFVGIHPKKSYLGVNIVLKRARTIPAADKVEQVSANRFHHYFKITNGKELNKQFAAILKEAYDDAGQKK